MYFSHHPISRPGRLAAWRGVTAALGALVLGLVVAVPAAGQGDSPFVYTVGNTYSMGGKTYAYLLWHPADATTTFGKTFAIYRKDGNAAAANPYTKLSIQTVQTAPAPIHAMLKLGGQFDANGDMTAERINLLYADSTTQPDEILDPPPAAPDVAIATQFGHLLEIAKGDPKILNRLLLLGRAHPGVMIALGHAFAIKVSPASLQTYEVRELDNGGNDLRVVGRVTLDAANPTVLPAPGRPHQVLHPDPPDVTATVASPKDHLACRFRWGTPNPLRRLVPHSFGYNIYRVKESVATLLGWDVAAPNTSDLESLVAASGGLDPDAKRVNVLPIIATKLLTDAEAANPADQETFFTHDDNDPPENPFQDGDTFYYFVAGREIAGHPGATSLGTRITYCDRLPPTVPVIEAVDNVFTAPPTAAELEQLKGTQHFRLRIRQVPEAPIQDSASTYYIYRWDYAQEALILGGNPAVNLVGTVAHIPSAQFVDWEDTGAGAPKITPADSATWAGKVVWYTVRSEDNTACSPKNLSGHSPPAFGVLRDRVGPGRPGSTARRCRALPVTDNGSARTESKDNLFLPDDALGFVVEAIRTDKMIQSIDIQVDLPSTAASPDYATTRFFSISDIRHVLIPLEEEDGATIMLRCRTQTSQESNWATATTIGAPQDEDLINVYPFNCSVVPRYTPITSVPPTETPPIHEPVGPGGTIVGPSGTLILPLDTKEWRLYRRVLPDGALQLIARGSGDFLPNEVVNWDDSAPPTANDTEVCYYGQVFDENGNAGPLTEIGCFKFVNGNLATPMLTEPELLAQQGGQAQLRLKWFCDPVGIKRFEIWAAEDGGGDPQLTSPQLSNKLGSIDGAVIDADIAGIAFSAFQMNAIDGSTAEFSVDLLVATGKAYIFGVRGVGSGDFNTRATGPFSNVVEGIWKDPDVPNQPVIPWPDRALPIVNDLGYDVADCIKGEGPFYAQPLPVNSDDGSAVILMGIYTAITQSDGPDETFLAAGSEPLDMFFKFRKQAGPKTDFAELTPIYPFVVYRHQVPNAANPSVVPNLVQCSPLIDRLAYKTDVGITRVRDPFFLFVSFSANLDNLEIPFNGVFDRDNTFGTDVASGGPTYVGSCNAMMLWKDHLPAIAGASYQYLIVHFDELGEIDRVIPTNIVNH